MVSEHFILEWERQGSSLHSSAEGQSVVLFSVQAQHTDKPRCDAITKATLKQQIWPTCPMLATKSLQVGAEPNLEMANPVGQGNPLSAHQRALHRLPGPLKGPRKFLVK